MLTIVPNHVRDSINKKLDEVFREQPKAAKDREFFYHQLLEYYDKNGVIPDFELQKKGR